MSLFVCFYCLIGWVGASRGLSRKVMFLVTNYRIFLTRRTSCHAENHGWSRMSVMNFLFITNYRIVSSHGESRRSRIIELSNFLHTESRGGHELSNYRIFFTRSVAEGHELSNSRINTFNHTENRGRSRVLITNYRDLSLDPLTNGR